MFEAALILAVCMMGFLIRTLFLENKQIRSELESRLKAIEGLEGPFARTLTDSGPAPLKHALDFAIHLDTRFWTETLQLTPAELDEVKTSIRVHNDLSKEADAKDFDQWFYGDIRVRIQEWRGGYTHIEVDYPSLRPEKQWSVDLYSKRQAGLWRLELPAPAEESISHGTLWLKWNGYHAKLYATGGRFGYASFMDTEPAPQNVFLTVPTEEGPRAEPYFKPGCRVEFYPDVRSFLPPWERRYEHLDLEKGLAWSLTVEDCDLLTRSKANTSDARRLLLAEWRERFAWDDAGKEWFNRVAKAVDAAHEEETAELERERVVEPSEDDQPPAI